LILRKLTLANFRQFKGVQHIEFAYDSTHNQNVTVLFGENGRGKTGIFRAIMFCLFGDRLLSQDGDVPGSEMQLVNSSALESSGGKPVETYVDLEFMHKEIKYNLKRTILGLRDGERTVEESSAIRMIETSSSGNATVVDIADIDKVVSSILDRRVRDYFLFDGEKIERLTRANLEQRREIGKGIRNLLNVDALETARRATERLTKDLEDQLRKDASPELARLLKRLGDNEQVQKDKKQRVEDIGSELYLARNEISKVDKELESYREIRNLVEKRKMIEQMLQNLEQQAKEQLSKMKDMAVKASALLVSSTIIKVFQHIDQQKQKGEIPSEIRKDLIERILSEHRCICGNEICEGIGSYDHIIEWKNRTSDTATQDSALNLWRFLSGIQGNFEDDVSQIENRLMTYGNIRNERESARLKLEELRKEIGSSERQDASKLDAHRKQLEEKISKLDRDSVILENQLAELESEHGQLVAQLNEERIKQGRHDELSRRASLARETRDALQAVYDDFTKEIKILIGEKATKLFHQLLDSEGRDNLRTVVVNNDYSLQVLDRWGRPFLANISAGQRQIMSISFIAALAQVAAKDTLLEMPLFMDTPFGRLSYEHRQNLIKMVPQLSSQWILLATDTEFRKQEARLLTINGTLGKFYMLRSMGDGSTTIEKRDVNTVRALLRDEEDLQ
jgi:DNA sulfur modification protein DndD